MKRLVIVLCLLMLATPVEGKKKKKKATPLPTATPVVEESVSPEIRGRVYDARVLSVVDGDTIVANIDLGLSVVLANQRIRFFGIDAPELKGETKDAGLAAKAWLTEELGDGMIVLFVRADAVRDNFGRVLAIPIKNNENLCSKMVAEGHAVDWVP